MLFQVLINGIIAGLLYALIALGFSLIYSGTKIFHIAHGAVYTVTPYLIYCGFNIFNYRLGLQGWASYFISIFCAIVGASLLGLLVDALVYRPLLNRRSAPLVTFISSLGFYIIIVNIIAIIFGNEVLVLSQPDEPIVMVGAIMVTRIQILQLVMSVLLLILVLVVLKKTLIGRKIRGFADNPLLLNILGYDTNRIRSAMFLLGSGLAACAAVLTTFDIGVNPQVGMSLVLTATVAVIIGGVGSHYGAIIGAMIIGLVQNLVMWYASAQWKDATTFVILVLVLVMRHEGLFVFSKRVEEQ
jgi:branched-chain amino acid transport system permease protein